MGLMSRVLCNSLLCALQRLFAVKSHRTVTVTTVTVTWRNPTSASSTDPHVSTQQRRGFIPALARVVVVHARRDASYRNGMSAQTEESRPFQNDLDNLSKISVQCSVYFPPASLKPPPRTKKFPNTYAPWPPLPSVWQPGAEWNVSRQRMSTHKRQLWFRQTLRGGEGNIKAKVKSSLGSSAPRFT